MSAYHIRDFESWDDFTAAEELQKQVWRGDYPLATNIMVVLQRHGGVCLGAFAPDDKLLGFVLSFACPTDIRGARHGLCHHSHIAAILPELQGRGIGEALKRAQADTIRARNINLMTWTYDPLEAKNARLNMGKLGAICRHYYENYYGDMQDELNIGIPTDRFEVEWWLDLVEHEGKSHALPDDIAQLRDPNNWRDTQQIEISPNFQQLKRADHAAAIAMRIRTREQFQSAFAAGYIVVGFNASLHHAAYTLVRV